MVLIQPLDALEDAYRKLKSRQLEVLPATGNMPSPVMILVAPEPDALCAAKMLTALLRSDGITYNLKPVASHGHLTSHVRASLEKDEGIVSIFMINCGGTFRLVEDLALQSRVVVYVLDSHRPYDLSNVHSEQVQILHDSLDINTQRYPEPEPDEDDEEDEDGLDELEEVGPGRDEDSDEEDEDGEGSDEEGGGRRSDGSEGAGADGEPSPKRRKRSEKLEARRLRDAERIAARAQRREGTLAQRRARERQRIAAVRAYYAGTSFGCATAVLMYEMVNQMNKASNHDLWMSILGLTDHFLHERVALPTYSSLQSHISSEALRLGNETPAQQAEAMALRAAQAGNRALDAVVTKVGHIGDLSDYRFQLLRHWSLYSALKHSPYVASRLETWTEQGKSKLRLLLTELGIPTADAKQAFRVLGVEKKTRLDELIDARGADARYNIPDIRFKSFVRVRDTPRPRQTALQQQQTPTLSLSACDMVQSMCALLELPHHDNAGKERYQDWSWERGFWACFDALACDQKAVGLVLRGLGQSVALSRALLRQAEALTVGKAVRPGGDFRYAILPDSPDAHFFAHPLALTKLALFISECVRAQKGSLLPLVLAAPVPERGAHLVLAVLGTQLNPDVLLKNPFGNRFHMAGEPELPEKEEEDYQLDESEDERRQRLVDYDQPELARLRVKQESFDSAIVEVQSEDLETFLERLTQQDV